MGTLVCLNTSKTTIVTLDWLFLLEIVLWYQIPCCRYYHIPQSCWDSQWSLPISLKISSHKVSYRGAVKNNVLLLEGIFFQVFGHILFLTEEMHTQDSFTTSSGDTPDISRYMLTSNQDCKNFVEFTNLRNELCLCDWKWKLFYCQIFP